VKPGSPFRVLANAGVRRRNTQEKEKPFRRKRREFKKFVRTGKKGEKVFPEGKGVIILNKCEGTGRK